MTPTLVAWMLAALAALFVLVTYVCYFVVFRRFPNIKTKQVVKPPKEGDEAIRAGIDFCNTLHFEDVWITSQDGLRLHARLTTAGSGKDVVMMFHGYRSSAKHDFSAAIPYLIGHGWSLLMVDHRAHGQSAGKTISFGVNEREDCRRWVEYITGRLGGNARIILHGISMGAATVLMASGLPLPETVKGIVADCGYTSPEAIIKKCTRILHLPVATTYFFIKLGARVFGHFDLEACSAPEALQKCRLPVLFIHGEADGFVPCDMSRENYRACPEPKTLFTVPNADHGYSYLVDKKGAETQLDRFFDSLH